VTTDRILSLLIGYLLGSIPFGVILTRLAGKGDVRQVGSGNIGATNVMRAAGKGLAAATLVLDALKATVAVLIARELWPGTGPCAAAGASPGRPGTCRSTAPDRAAGAGGRAAWRRSPGCPR